MAFLDLCSIATLTVIVIFCVLLLYKEKFDHKANMVGKLAKKMFIEKFGLTQLQKKQLDNEINLLKEYKKYLNNIHHTEEKSTQKLNKEISKTRKELYNLLLKRRISPRQNVIKKSKFDNADGKGWGQWDNQYKPLCGKNVHCSEDDGVDIPKSELNGYTDNLASLYAKSGVAYPSLCGDIPEPSENANIPVDELYGTEGHDVDDVGPDPNEGFMNGEYVRLGYKKNFG